MKKQAKALVNATSKTSKETKPAAKAKKTDTAKPAPAKRLRGK